MPAGADDSRGPRLGRGLRGAVVVLVALVLVGVMLRLSLWQWDRAQARHSLLNYSYAVEWVLFAVLTVAGLARLAVEHARVARPGSDPDAGSDAGSVAVSEGGRGVAGDSGPVIGPPLRPGEDLEEITWIRLRRRMGLDRR